MFSKKSVAFFFLVIVCTTICLGQSKSFNIAFRSTKQFQNFLRFSGNSYPLISAHRGGPAKGFPENCTATFANTISFHAAIIETDIALSKDSVLVMMHDNTLDRTTNGSGKIGDYTYNELQDLFLKDNEGNATLFKIQTLDQVLQWGRDKVI